MPLINEKASTAPCDNPNVENKSQSNPTSPCVPPASHWPEMDILDKDKPAYSRECMEAPPLSSYARSILEIPPVERYEDLLRQAFGAKEDYRQTKAKLFLKLSTPTDGSKKPSNDTIMSMIDTDVELAAMRAIRASTEIDLKVFELQYGIIGTVHA